MSDNDRYRIQNGNEESVPTRWRSLGLRSCRSDDTTDDDAFVGHRQGKRFSLPAVRYSSTDASSVKSPLCEPRVAVPWSSRREEPTHSSRVKSSGRPVLAIASPPPVDSPPDP